MMVTLVTPKEPQCPALMAFEPLNWDAALE
jgi:hypothetical protein